MKLFAKGKPTAILYIVTTLVILAASGLIWYFLPATWKEIFYSIASLFGGDRNIIISPDHEITTTPYPFATQMIAFYFLICLVGVPISLCSIFFPYYWISEKTGPQSKKFRKLLFFFTLLLIFTSLDIAALWKMGTVCPTCVGVLGIITLPMAIGAIFSVEILLAMIPCLIIVSFLKPNGNESSSCNDLSSPKDTHEVNTSQKSLNTITPLLGAIIGGDLTLVQTALLDHPEQLNTAYAQNGNTPLHVAALNGYTEIVKLLLAQPGINKTRTNNDGKTAADLAREKGFAQIEELIRK